MHAVAALWLLALLPASLAGIVSEPTCARYRAKLSEDTKAGDIDTLRSYSEAGMEAGEYVKDPTPYDWFLTQKQRTMGMAMQGDSSRLRSALNRLQKCSNRFLTVSFIGSSATHPTAESMAAGLSYPRWVELILRKALAPNDEAVQSRIRFFDTNGPLNVSSSAAAAPVSPHYCHHVRIPEDSDIVFIDHAVSQAFTTSCVTNPRIDFKGDVETPRKEFEHLLRNLMILPNKPAIVFVNSMYRDPNFNFVTSNCERDVSEFASYYEVPSVSLKTAAFHHMIADKKGYKISPLFPRYNDDKVAFEKDAKEAFFVDVSGHLNGATSARALGELAAQVVLDAAASLVAQPFNTTVEYRKAQRSLQVPMIVPHTQELSSYTLRCEEYLRDHPEHSGESEAAGTDICDRPLSDLPSLLRGSSKISPECATWTYNVQPPWESKPSRGQDPSLSPNANPKVRHYQRPSFLDASYMTGEQQTEGYTFWTPDEDRMASQTYYGNQARLRSLMDRYLNKGANFSATFFGGSVTVGYGRQEAMTYPEWTELILRKTFGDPPPGRMTFTNAGIRATTSALMASCLSVYAPKDTDIFFVEYSHNDMVEGPGRPMATLRRSFERLIRKLLNYPNRPAVILYHHFNYMKGSVTSAVQKAEATLVAHEMMDQGSSQGLAHLKSWKYGGYAEANTERDYNEPSWYYGLPMVSVKAGLFHLMENELDGFMVYRPRYVADPYTPGLELADLDPRLQNHSFYWDFGHPDGNAGYRAMGELAAQVVLDAAASLKSKPLTAEEEADVLAPLLAPMLPMNYQSEEETCLINTTLSQIASANQGWNWTDEGRGKWGWVATEVGSTLNLKFNTMTQHAATESAYKNHLVGISVSHLKSYEHMGMATVNCVSGCTCEELLIDANTQDQSSQLRMQTHKVSQSEECEISLTVVEATNDPLGGHKFKVGGIMVAEDLTMEEHSAFNACIPGEGNCLGPRVGD